MLKKTKMTGRTCVGEWRLSDLDLGYSGIVASRTGTKFAAPDKFASVGMTDRDGGTWLLEGTREEMIACLKEAGYNVVDRQNPVDKAMSVLREFVEDVKLAYGTGVGDDVDSDALDWPDLLVTYRKAAKLLKAVSEQEERRTASPPPA